MKTKVKIISVNNGVSKVHETSGARRGEDLFVDGDLGTAGDRVELPEFRVEDGESELARMFYGAGLKSYSDYTVKVSSEPSYYGSDCTQSDADNIVANLKKMVQAEFSGIQVIDYVDGSGSSATAGPDQSVVDQVDLWIVKNWMAAL